MRYGQGKTVRRRAPHSAVSVVLDAACDGREIVEDHVHLEWARVPLAAHVGRDHEAEEKQARGEEETSVRHEHRRQLDALTPLLPEELPANRTHVFESECANDSPANRRTE